MSTDNLTDALSQISGVNSQEKEVLYVQDYDTDKPKWEYLDSLTQQYVSTLAEKVFSPSDKGIFIIGESGSGKSFIVNALDYNFQRFQDKLQNTMPHMIDITGRQGEGISSNNVNAYLHEVAGMMQTRVDSLTFVTDSPQLGYLFTDEGANVILEIDPSSYSKLQHDASNVFGSWFTLDIDSLLLPKKQLENALHYFALPVVNRTYRAQFTHEDIRQFVTYYNKLSDTQPIELYGKKVMPGSPGVWNQIFLRACAHVVMTSSYAEQSDRMTRVAQELQDECTDAINSARADSGDDDDVVAQLPDAMRQFFESNGIPVMVSTNSDGDELEQSGQPSEDVHQEYKFRTLNEISRRLKKNILGQDRAVNQVVDGLATSAAGLRDNTSPLSFMFFGPTGVGKTATAQTMARHMCTDEFHMIRLDMSEYSDSNTSHKLFGAPPGYVGYEEGGGKLTQEVMKHPHSVILLDEVEKAHHSIWDQFLQVLDAGVMSTSSGKEVDFSQCVIVMTSNLGTQEFVKNSMGFSNGNSGKDFELLVKKSMENYFRPEFINRIDSKVVFSHLSEKYHSKILLKEINDVSSKVSAQGYTLNTPRSDIRQELLRRSEVNKYGAREIQRVVKHSIADPVAKQMLSSSRKDNPISVVLNSHNEIQVETDSRMEHFGD